MKKVALVFVVAVLVPSLVLAWLAVRSLRDQQFLLERQQSLLDQRVTDALAQNISAYLAQQQQEFAAQVESLAGAGEARVIAARFDDQIRQRWPLAEVGFCVTASGKILSPAPNARSEAQLFRLDNSGFLGNREPVEVYWNANSGAANGVNGGVNNTLINNRAQTAQSSFALNNGVASVAPQPPSPQRQQLQAVQLPSSQNAVTPPNQSVSLAANSFSGRGGGRGGGGGFGGGGGGGFGSGADRSNHSATVQSVLTVARPVADAVPPASQRLEVPNANESNQQAAPASTRQTLADDENSARQGAVGQQLPPAQNFFNYKAAQSRKVSPQSQAYQTISKTEGAAVDENLSRVVPAEAEFSQLIGNETDGMLARFLQNKLKLMFWHRLNREPDLVFGAQLNLTRVVEDLRSLVQPGREFQNDLCLALLDDNARPVVTSRANFSANWKRPFVATEIGDALPHWEVAAYLVNPAQLTQAAHTAQLTLGLLVAVLVLAIGVGSWLIGRSLSLELKLARQKTDFVSNVSHELKTPLTSIRMFSELLAEGRVTDGAKQRSYLNIITAEAARLTRLINNVLDFSRLESGEKKYNFQPCDLTGVVRAAAETFRPHLEAGGFKFDCELPTAPISVRGDPDALAQIIVNLLSNAEKYSNGGKEVAVQLAQRQVPLPHAEIKVLDRGSGVPRGSGEKIFEKFYRAHDSLGSGIQGSGLGLTIARQIARAHGGDVVYEPRAGGGSCFVLRLPLKPQTTENHE